MRFRAWVFCQETIRSQAIHCEGLTLIAPDAIDK
jgi:hypothetical protein